jgi:hypothetical protein
MLVGVLCLIQLNTAYFLFPESDNRLCFYVIDGDFYISLGSVVSLEWPE